MPWTEEDRREYQKQWYQENKESHKKAVKEREEEIKEWFYEWKREEWSCEECREDHFATLELHHTDENEYEIQLGVMAGDGYAKETIRSEYKKGRVLCANCHRKHHYNDGSGQWANSN